eukprot:TRINITY_DN29436_c0_g1_i2.p1 TRINITY_DN29436_c0_g1~~TRINITY_DN29436_c0_g1_i2.p1  ORF type:complete len:2078 (+),score=363.83 TRINITY_DN29436_c0_g1_i2:31-6234(+)
MAPRSRSRSSGQVQRRPAARQGVRAHSRNERIDPDVCMAAPLLGSVISLQVPSHRQQLEAQPLEECQLPESPEGDGTVGNGRLPWPECNFEEDSDSDSCDMEPGRTILDDVPERMPAQARVPHLAARFPAKVRFTGSGISELRRAFAATCEAVAELGAKLESTCMNSSSSSSSMPFLASASSASSSAAAAAESTVASTADAVADHLLVDAVDWGKAWRRKFSANERESHRRRAQSEILRLVAGLNGAEFSFAGLFTRPHLGVPVWSARYEASTQGQSRGASYSYELEVALLRPPGKQCEVMFELALLPRDFGKDVNGRRLPLPVMRQVRHHFFGDDELMAVRTYRPVRILRGRADSLDMLFRTQGSSPRFEIRTPRPRGVCVRVDFDKTDQQQQTAGQIYRNLGLHGASSSICPEFLRVTGVRGDCCSIAGTYQRVIIRGNGEESRRPHRRHRGSEGNAASERQTISPAAARSAPSVADAAGGQASRGVPLSTQQKDETTTPLRFSRLHRSPCGFDGESETDDELGGSFWESDSAGDSASSYGEEDSEEELSNWMYYFCAETSVMLCPLVYRSFDEDFDEEGWDSEDEMFGGKSGLGSNARWVFVRFLGQDIHAMSEVALQQSLTEAFAWMDIPGAKDLAGEVDVAISTWAALPNARLSPVFSAEDMTSREVLVPREPVVYSGPSSWQPGRRPWEVSCQVLQSSLGVLPPRTRGRSSCKPKVSNCPCCRSSCSSQQATVYWDWEKLERDILPGNNWVSLEALELRASALARMLRTELRNAFQPAVSSASQHVIAAPGPSHRARLCEVPEGLAEWVEFGEHDLKATAKYLADRGHERLSNSQSGSLPGGLGGDQALGLLPMAPDPSMTEKEISQVAMRSARAMCVDVRFSRGRRSSASTLDVRLRVRPGLLLVGLLSFEWRLESRRASSQAPASTVADGEAGVTGPAASTELNAVTSEPAPAASLASSAEASRTAPPDCGASPSHRGPFTLPSNLEDPQHEQLVRFKAYPLRPEQLRTLHWMREAERAEVPFVYDHEVVDDMPGFNAGWRLHGRLRRAMKIRGGILADKVGYGKTATTIGLVESTRDEGLFEVPPEGCGCRIPSRATLVLCPSNLLTQWVREVQKFVGDDITVVALQTYAEVKRISARELAEADIVIANYRLFYSSPYLAQLRSFSLELERARSKAPTPRVKAAAAPPKEAPSARRSNRLGTGCLVSKGKRWPRVRRKSDLSSDELDPLPLSWPPRSPQVRLMPQRPIHLFERQYARVLAQLDSPFDGSAGEEGAGGAAARSEVIPEPPRKRLRGKGPRARGCSPPASSSTCALERFLGSVHKEDSRDESKSHRGSRSQRQTKQHKRKRELRRGEGASRAAPGGGRQSQASRHRTAPPLLELFYWKRIVLDEFHELLSGHPPAQVAVRYLRSRYRWGLSGTLPCKSPSDVTKAAEFFNVFLRATRSSPPASHALCQRWLDHCVRRNTTGLPDLRSEEAIVPVRQHPAERALYLQLAQAASDADLAGEEDASALLALRRRGQEGLVKLCSHFQLSGGQLQRSAADECDAVLQRRNREVVQAQQLLKRSLLEAWTLTQHLKPCRRLFEGDVQGLAFLEPEALLTELTPPATPADMANADSADPTEAARCYIRSCIAEIRQLEASGKNGEELPALAAATTPSRSSSSSSGARAGGEAGGISNRSNESAARFAKGLAALGGAGGSGEEACQALQLRLKRASAPKAVAAGASASEKEAARQALATWRGTSAAKTLRQQADRVAYMASYAASEARRTAKTLEAKARLVHFFAAAVRSSRSEELARCPICFEDVPLRERSMLPCAHVGCARCFEEVARRDGRCPVCRADFYGRQVLHLEVPDNLGAPASDECGKFGSKIMRLLRFLEELYIREPEAKVILFVQWEDLKKKVAGALREFGVGHSVLQGSVWARQRAIEEFQTGQGGSKDDKSCKLLLLSLQDSASGTNLTAASHVVLFHPVVAQNREAAVACEMQAIGRALRAGQERCVRIWRFMVVGTAEQKVTEEHQKDLWQRFRSEAVSASSAAVHRSHDSTTNDQDADASLI